jgi:hypothetical protein
VATALPTAATPLFSALFLAIERTSRFLAPFPKASAIISTPSGPKPQLLIWKIFKNYAYSKNPDMALAPKGLTALLARSTAKIFFAIKESPKDFRAWGISSFNLPTKISL